MEDLFETLPSRSKELSMKLQELIIIAKLLGYDLSINYPPFNSIEVVLRKDGSSISMTFDFLTKQSIRTRFKIIGEPLVEHFKEHSTTMAGRTYLKFVIFIIQEKREIISVINSLTKAI